MHIVTNQRQKQTRKYKRYYFIMIHAYQAFCNESKTKTDRFYFIMIDAYRKGSKTKTDMEKQTFLLHID